MQIKAIFTQILLMQGKNDPQPEYILVEKKFQ